VTPAYRPDVDGLRAVAVLPVLLYHAGVTGFGGGFVGVDVFFVISGFVIALSLNRDFESDRFSLPRFYERRARRILPALTVVYAATFVVAIGGAPPEVFAPFSASLHQASIFLSNHYFWDHAGYFDPGDPFRPLLHTWSLAVEEQYYLFAPIVLYAVFRILRRRWIWGIGHDCVSHGELFLARHACVGATPGRAARLEPAAGRAHRPRARRAATGGRPLDRASGGAVFLGDAVSGPGRVTPLSRGRRADSRGRTPSLRCFPAPGVAAHRGRRSHFVLALSGPLADAGVRAVPADAVSDTG
jgi:hypothetical protein